MVATHPLFADSVLSPQRQITNLGDGIYTIRHKDPFPGWVHGNTTVIIGEREVFVVDSCQLPSAAREDIAQIRKWTDKPVRYVLNTHWHTDHNGGNKEYVKAFGSLDIIAHRETRIMMDANGPHVPNLWLKEVTATQATLRRRIETGTGADGKPLSAAKKAQALERLSQLDDIVKKAGSFVYQGPTVTFDHELRSTSGVEKWTWSM